jgi:hypothetical protein
MPPLHAAILSAAAAIARHMRMPVDISGPRKWRRGSRKAFRVLVNGNTIALAKTPDENPCRKRRFPSPCQTSQLTVESASKLQRYRKAREVEAKRRAAGAMR